MMLWTRPLGDTGPALAATLRDATPAGSRFGPVRDLSGVASVLGVVRRWSDRTVVQSAAATIVSASAGTVTLPLTTMISTSSGLHGVEFRVIAGDQRTYPVDPLVPWWLLIAAPLGTSGTGVTPPITGAPLFLVNGTAGLVERNGEMAFTGADTTITVDAAVTWFQVANWDTQTVWSPGHLPTLIQAGATFDPGVATALLASGGNMVVLTKSGSTWFAAGTGRATIWTWNGTSYVASPSARLIEQATGDPAPTGVANVDIVLKQNP
jgi:hypothetical protein